MIQDMYQIFREVTERVCGDLEIEKSADELYAVFTKHHAGRFYVYDDY